jgi:hypothetical protein
LTLRLFFLAAFFFLLRPSFAQDVIVKGIVFDKDSITPMQFAYVINRNSSRGIVADEKGSFTIRIHLGDTLCFSYVGYSLTKVFTHLLKDSITGSVLYLKAYLKSKNNELNAITITPHNVSKEQREMYQRKINEYRLGISSPLASPISALYYTFSKKGKELKKLSFLYDQLLIDEVKESRLSPERIRSITGNDTLDTPTFLNHCYLPNQFVVFASDYDLFFVVHKYYKQYMEEGRKIINTRPPSQ